MPLLFTSNFTSKKVLWQLVRTCQRPSLYLKSRLCFTLKNGEHEQFEEKTEAELTDAGRPVVSFAKSAHAICANRKEMNACIVA